MTDKYDQLDKLSKSIYCSLVKCMAKERQITIKEAVEFKWSDVSKELRQKYVLMLEEKALEECGLDIGKCESMWGGNMLMSFALNYFQHGSASRKSKFLEEVCDSDDWYSACNPCATI